MTARSWAFCLTLVMVGLHLAALPPGLTLWAFELGHPLGDARHFWTLAVLPAMVARGGEVPWQC